MKGLVEMLLLKATERNWGLIGPGAWEKHSWKINDDGWYRYKETYRSNGTDEIPEIPDLVEEGVLSDDQMRRLRTALAQDWNNEKADACDGTAWEFKLYENGSVTKHRDTGYIYGIEPYETIAAIMMEIKNL